MKQDKSNANPSDIPDKSVLQKFGLGDLFPSENLDYFNAKEFKVSAEELRQYFYCPRIPFWRHVRKIRPQMTYLMQRGTEFHQKVVYAKNNDALARQVRNVLAPNDPETEQFHDVYLESSNVHLVGRLDLFERRQEEIYPVEIKTGMKPTTSHAIHHYIQLTAQALLLEDHFGGLVTKARVVYTGSSESEWIEITIDMKERVLRAIQLIMNMIREEIVPSITPHPQKCPACEFERYCRRI